MIQKKKGKKKRQEAWKNRINSNKQRNNSERLLYSYKFNIARIPIYDVYMWYTKNHNNNNKPTASLPCPTIRSTTWNHFTKPEPVMIINIILCTVENMTFQRVKNIVCYYLRAPRRICTHCCFSINASYISIIIDYYNY